MIFAPRLLKVDQQLQSGGRLPLGVRAEALRELSSLSLSPAPAINAPIRTGLDPQVRKLAFSFPAFTKNVPGES